MWFSVLVAALTAYLLGNLNGSVCISALVVHEDVRSHGSGNAGLTNFVRNYGVQHGLLVLAIDFIKAVCACLVAGLMLKSYGYYLEGVLLGGVAVTLGHDFPALLGFRGGKGILCGLAIAAVADWRIALAILAVFLLAYLATQYVSLGSILAAVTYAVLFILWHHDRPLVMAGGIFIGVLAVVMHRANIGRLLHGKETKTVLHKKGSRL